MANIVCIKHPRYKGKGTPVLSCKTCCSLFIALMQAKNQVHLDRIDSHLEDIKTLAKELKHEP